MFDDIYDIGKNATREAKRLSAQGHSPYTIARMLRSQGFDNITDTGVMLALGYTSHEASNKRLQDWIDSTK